MGSAVPPSRCTQRLSSGEVSLCEGVLPAQAWERLAAYEDLAQYLRDRSRELDGQIDGLRAAGKVKTVTYRQLVGTRMALREMLGYYEERSL